MTVFVFESGVVIALHDLQYWIVPPETWVLAVLCSQQPTSEQLVALTRVIV